MGGLYAHKKKEPWQIQESEAAPEEAYLNRRQFFKTAGMYSIGARLLLSGIGANEFNLFDRDEKLIEIPKTPTSNLYPAKRNPAFILDRPLTEEKVAARYNNFYEFSYGTSPEIVSGHGEDNRDGRDKVHDKVQRLRGIRQRPLQRLSV